MSARKPVPAPEAAVSSPALDELVAGAGKVTHGDLALDLLDPDPHNPERRSTDIDEGLAASIAAEGVWTPVLVRPNTDDPGRWWLIAGHRRVLHARHVGLTHVPATMLPPRTDLEAVRTLLGENIHRQDLRISEEAHLLQGLLDLGVPETDLVREVNKSATWVRSRRAVGRLPKDTQTLIDGRQITLGQVERIDEFADHPKIYDRLVAALGTDQLDWRIADANRELKADAAMDRAAQVLAKAGVKVIRKADTQGPKRTHDRVGGVGPDASTRAGKNLSAKAVKDLATANPDLAAVKHTGDYMGSRWYELVVPRRPEPEADPAEVEAAAAQQAADEEHRRLLADAGHDATIARRLRIDFITRYLTGELAMTKDQVAEVSALAVRDLLRSATWGDGLRLWDEWLAMSGRLVDADEDGALERAFASLPAGVPALLYLAGEVEGKRPRVEHPSHQIPAVVWLQGFASEYAATFSRVHWQTAVGWYALLKRLGYEASPAELDALGRGRADKAVAAGEQEQD